MEPVHGCTRLSAVPLVGALLVGGPRDCLLYAWALATIEMQSVEICDVDHTVASFTSVELGNASLEGQDE